MPHLSPRTEGTETLSPLAEGAQTLAGLAEGSQTLAALAEKVGGSIGGTWPSLRTFPSLLHTFTSVRVTLDAPVLAASGEGTLDLTPLGEV